RLAGGQTRVTGIERNLLRRQRDGSGDETVGAAGTQAIQRRDVDSTEALQIETVRRPHANLVTLEIVEAPVGEAASCADHLRVVPDPRWRGGIICALPLEVPVVFELHGPLGV